MLKNRTLLVSSIIASSLLLATGYWFFKSNPKNENELIVGTVSGYAPYVSLSMQGEYEGFDIDVAREVAQRLDKKLVLKDLGSMVPLLFSLNQDSIDMAIWAMEINNRRLKEMIMIQYQGGGAKTYPLIFWQQIPAGIRSLEDFKKYPDAVICSEPGSSQDQFLNSIDFVTKKPMEKVIDMILDLRFQKSTAALIDPAIVDDLKSKNPELQVLDIPLPTDFQSFGNGICLKRDNTQLAAQIQQVIAAMKADGTIKKLEQKWNLKG